MPQVILRLAACVYSRQHCLCMWKDKGGQVDTDHGPSNAKGHLFTMIPKQDKDIQLHRGPLGYYAMSLLTDPMAIVVPLCLSVCLPLRCSIFSHCSLLSLCSLHDCISLSLSLSPPPFSPCCLVTNMSKRPAFLTVFTAAYTLSMHTIIAVYNLQS